ncbi:hypothetical protein ABW636_04455 [Aquimarina sp. 2201CG1-2-11]|uniref:hypothetical protein n=1 Tax=Aquimarina discodermiae TaxID=3231043 RepID=UPI0034619FB0
MIKKILVIILAHVAVISYAQEGTSSPYSFYGIGVAKFKGTIENRSMGGLSVFADSIHLNLQNPASYSKLGLTAYTVGGTFSNYEISNANNETSSGDSASLDYLAIGVPAGKFGFGFGVVPLTAVGYEIRSIDEDGAENQFTGNGGVNKVFLAAGVKINENLSIGLDVNYNFGNIENKTVVSVPGVQYSTRELTSTDISSFSASFGVTYTRVIKEKLEIFASAVSTPSFELASERSRELASVIINNAGQEGIVEAQQINIEDKEIDIPAEFKFGAGIGQPRKWFAGAEYVYVDSKDFQGFESGQSNATYESGSKYKLGGYYIPKYNSLTSYFSRMVYRAGFRYEETGLNLSNQSIDEFGISFGVGLPVGRLFSNANINFEYGQRGTTDFGLIKEEFFNFSIGFSFNDKWFRKIKFN